MCGILGVLPALCTPAFDAALDRLRHRGPDSGGIWHDEPEISLGHRRLSILDLSEQGGQPMHSECGRYVVVFNGEIYNFLEIKVRLESRGRKFRSQSDTEVLLAAFIEWGPEFHSELNGMWALAIWDRQEKRLFLSRDRFGKKPLFYAQVGHRFIFASEMKAIYPFLPEVKPSADFAWMSNNLFKYEATEKCLVHGIKRFPAGHWGVFKDGKLSLQKYWETLDHLVSVPQSYPKQVEQFKELFIDACRIRMRSDVPIGTALSGGLDSSATITTMAHIEETATTGRISRDWQHAFVATFPGGSLDESDYAKQVVEHINVPATYITIDPLKEIENLESALYMFEDLYLTSPIPMMQLYRTIRNHGVRVTLDGHGADEILSGYGNALLELLPEAGFDIKKIREILATYRNFFPKAVSSPGRDMVPFLLYCRYMGRRLAKRVLRRGVSFETTKQEKFDRLDGFNKHLYQLTHDTVLPTLLRNYDRYSMAHGVEIRMPFLDHRLVCYSLSLPWQSKVADGFTKKILRDSMHSLLPDIVRLRKPKIGFNSPIHEWMKGPLREYFLDIVSSRAFMECNLLDAQQVRIKVEEVINKVQPSLYEAEGAWVSLLPYLWEQSLKVGGN